MLDIEHPRRKAVAAQRKKKYDARRIRKAKASKPKTDRISGRDVIEQSERSSRVVLQEEQKEVEEERETDEEKNAEDEDKQNDSEEDADESENEIVVEKKVEAEEEEVQLNSRGRRINAPSRDTVPINQSSTYRRNGW